MTAAHDVPRGAIVVQQLGRSGQIGPLAPWITTASWAAAAECRYGHAWVVTPDGVLDPARALDLASSPARRAQEAVERRRPIPEPLVTLAKDAQRIAQNRGFFRALDVTRWKACSVPFVLQLHGLFFDAGIRLARALGAPSVLVVDACQVAEARSWGVRRPGWATLAERFGEVPQLRTADVVACVSEEVAASVTRLTRRRTGVHVVPNGVDTKRFVPGPPPNELRSQLDLAGAFVVGWTGSFRTFHGLDTLLDAAALARRAIPELALFLVGDGLQRPAIERRASALGVRAVFPGTISYGSMPEYLRLMDVAVALAPPEGQFHYSPVKLREYQAVGLPVIASDVGEMRRDLRPGVDALLVERGDPGSLASAITRMRDDRSAARVLGERGRAVVASTGSWDARLATLEGLLGIASPTPRTVP